MEYTYIDITAINHDRLRLDINSSGMTDKSYIQSLWDGETHLLKVQFTNTLSSEDKNILDGIVANNDTSALTDFQEESMLSFNLSYTEFKEMTLRKYLTWQYHETPTLYEIFAVDNQIKYFTYVNKVNDINLSDFETNFKPMANLVIKTWTGNANYTPSREWQSIGVKYDIVPPTLPDTFKQNIFDFKIESSFAGTDGMVELIGGKYFIKDVSTIHEDDILEFSIIDKDDMLGLFSSYGLVVGNDILELKKFIKTHAVIGGTLVSFEPGQVKLIPAGLYLRTSFTSHGNTNFSLKLDIILPA